MYTIYSISNQLSEFFLNGIEGYKTRVEGATSVNIVIVFISCHRNFSALVAAAVAGFAPSSFSLSLSLSLSLSRDKRAE